MIQVLIIVGIIVGLLYGCYISEGKLDAGFILALIGAIVGGFLFFLVGGIIELLGAYRLPMLGVCTLVVSVTYLVTHPDKMRILCATIKRLCGNIISHVKMSDSIIMRYVTRQTKKLIAIAPDFEWLDIRTSVSELGTRHIAQLLRERKSLRGAIKHVRKVLKQVAWQKEDREDFEKANARRSAQNIESLVLKLQKNEKDISEALDMLRHLEADLVVATTEIYKRDEIRTRLQGLVSRIQANSVAVQEARDEAGMHQQPRRLTE